MRRSSATFLAGEPATMAGVFEARKQQLIGAVYSVLNPQKAFENDNYIAPPQGSEDRATQYVQREIFGNFQIPTGSIGLQEGAVVALWFDGVNHILRLAFIQQNQLIPAPATATNNFFPCGLFGCQIKAITKFPVPVIQSQNLQIQPPLDNTAVYGRSVACQMYVYSDATSTTSAAMSGSLNASSVQDYRALISFEQATLKQAALNKKDGRVAIPCQTGVVVVQGPDIASKIGVVDTSRVKNSGDSGIAVDVTGGVQLSGDNISFDQPYSQGKSVGSGSCWLSTTTMIQTVPTTNYSGSVVPAFIPPPTYTIPNLGLDNVEYELTCKVSPSAEYCSNTYYPPVGTQLRATVSVITYYAQIDPTRVDNNGLAIITLATSFITQVVEDIVQPQPWAGPSTVSGQPAGLIENVGTYSLATVATPSVTFQQNYYQPQQQLTFSPVLPSPYYSFIGSFVTTSNSRLSGPTTSLTYIGQGPNNLPTTQNELSVPAGATVTSDAGVTYYYTAAGTPPTYTGGFCPIPCVSVVTQINVVAKDLYGRGLQGPARVVTWTNVAPGQNIVVRGTQIVQIVASNELVPFYSTANTDECISQDFWPMCTKSFNGVSTTFKRVYSGDEYKTLIDDVLPTLVAQDVVQDNPKLAALITELAPVKNAISYYADGDFATQGSFANQLSGLSNEIASGPSRDINELKSVVQNLTDAVDSMRAAGARTQCSLSIDQPTKVPQPGSLVSIPQVPQIMAAGEYGMSGGYCTDLSGSQVYGGQVYGGQVYGGQVYGSGDEFSAAGLFGSNEDEDDDEEVHASGLFVRPFGTKGSFIELIMNNLYSLAAQFYSRSPTVRQGPIVFCAGPNGEQLLDSGSALWQSATAALNWSPIRYSTRLRRGPHAGAERVRTFNFSLPPRSLWTLAHVAQMLTKAERDALGFPRTNDLDAAWAFCEKVNGAPQGQAVAARTRAGAARPVIFDNFLFYPVASDICRMGGSKRYIRLLVLPRTDEFIAQTKVDVANRVYQNVRVLVQKKLDAGDLRAAEKKRASAYVDVARAVREGRPVSEALMQYFLATCPAAVKEEVQQRAANALNFSTKRNREPEQRAPAVHPAIAASVANQLKQGEEGANVEEAAAGPRAKWQAIEVPHTIQPPHPLGAF